MYEDRSINSGDSDSSVRSTNSRKCKSTFANDGNSIDLTTKDKRVSTFNVFDNLYITNLPLFLLACNYG